MTANCGGGASRAKPGVADNVQLTGAGLAGLAELLAIPGIGEVLAFAVAGTSIATPVYCANDPPADPILTPTDIANALLVTQPSISLPALARITQWVLHTYWWDICECVSVPTPPRPPPSNPGGSQSDPGLPRTSPAPCFQWTGGLTLPAANGTGTLVDYTSRVMPQAGLPVTRTVPGATPTVQAVPIPPGLKSTTSVVQLGAGEVLSTGAFVSVGYWDAAGTSLRQDTIGQGSTSSAISLPNFVTPAGAATWAIYTIQAASGGQQSDFSVNFAANCGGPGFTSDCCPPDPSLDLRLKQITELLVEILNRPADSPGYVLGPSHGPVSGSASISIPGCRGMKVHINAGVPTPHQQEGNPPYEWDLGWMSVLTGDGMIEERRITRSDQLWLAASFPFATTFGYFLKAGIVATFTELRPPA